MGTSFFKGRKYKKRKKIYIPHECIKFLKNFKKKAPDSRGYFRERVYAEKLRIYSLNWSG